MQTQPSYKFTLEEKKILTLASLGGMLEFYDFVIYGIFSVYFAGMFFPAHNALISIIESYVVFVLGYLARPIGGIIFSHIGDEYGRKQVLIVTVVLMGLSSLGIGLLPTYNTIGIAAPISLLILRLLQGFALGGELPSTYVYIRESISHKASKAFGIIMSGIVSGLLLGMVLNFIINLAWNHQQISSFGWRIPFIFGGLLCIISYQIRKQLHETIAFERITDKPKFPIVYLFEHHLAGVLIGIVVTAALAASIVVFVIFMPTYLQNIVKLNAHFISIAMLAVIFINIITAFIVGVISEKFHFHFYKIFKNITIISLFLLPFCYWLISINSLPLVSLILLGIISGIFTTISPAIVTTLFPARVRLSGVALCYNLGFTIFGGLAPVIISASIKANANIYITPVVYMWVTYVLGFIGIVYIKKHVHSK